LEKNRRTLKHVSSTSENVAVQETPFKYGIIAVHMLPNFTASRPAVGPTQPPIQWVPGTLSLRVNQPGREADHLPPSSAEVKNGWSYTSTSPIRLHGVVLSLKKAQGHLHPKKIDLKYEANLKLYLCLTKHLVLKTHS
jgi:hypothetical protein